MRLTVTFLGRLMQQNMGEELSHDQLLYFRPSLAPVFSRSKGYAVNRSELGLRRRAVGR